MESKEDEDTEAEVSIHSSNSGASRRSTATKSRRGLRVGKYLLGDIIGSGYYADVHIATHTETNALYAVKVLDRRKFPFHVFEKQIRSEIRAMQSLCHPNIVSIHKVLMSGTRLYLVMDYMSGGELFAYAVKNGRLDESEAKHFFAQLIDAVSYCHWKGIYHRDLKLENLLLDDRRKLKVTDFGMSWVRDSALQTDELLFTCCGTIEYIPPELLLQRLGKSKGYRGDKADSWSCGVVLFALLAGGLPFQLEGLSHEEVLEQLVQIPVHFPSWIGPGPRDVIEKLLDPNPETRWSVTQIKSHEWLVDLFYEETFDSSSPKLTRKPSLMDEPLNKNEVVESGTHREILVRAGSVDSTIDMKRREELLEKRMSARIAEDMENARVESQKQTEEPILQNTGAESRTQASGSNEGEGLIRSRPDRGRIEQDSPHEASEGRKSRRKSLSTPAFLNLLDSIDGPGKQPALTSTSAQPNSSNAESQPSESEYETMEEEESVIIFNQNLETLSYASKREKLKRVFRFKLAIPDAATEQELLNKELVHHELKSRDSSESIQRSETPTISASKPFSSRVGGFRGHSRNHSRGSLSSDPAHDTSSPTLTGFGSRESSYRSKSFLSSDRAHIRALLKRDRDKSSHKPIK